MTSTTTPGAFLILHGWQNHRPAAHWQHWLADRLTERGHAVTYPQLPDPDDPALEVWLGELSRHLGDLDARRERVVIAHSLSVVLWLHAIARGLPGLDTVDRVLLVAPPSGPVLAGYPEVAEFVLPALDGLTLPSPTRLVAGDDDPYCPEGVQSAYGTPLGLTAELLPGAAHLDLDAGYGSWPSALQWCETGDASFTARPGQRP
ncbi:alpha/beta hydrolase [Streptomyces phaeoluteigriseus]|uniref:Alpha/beta hydrolase n=1 Tax=Streptomyces phaeoluteigriseus TaxID=114686 RepID=A0ABY4ZJC5_9ACTN|nr:alpha/beta hydrolase [Streptomyces phaeoluteigriseus]USQ88458.1 alpha/beta hydrolase [Streptomyces phaeoluteigriseus]